MPKEKTVRALLAVQVASAASVLVLQPGFDHPNSLGLDFGFVLLMLGVFALSWLVGSILACTLKFRRAEYLVGYFVSPFICVGLVVLSDVVS